MFSKRAVAVLGALLCLGIMQSAWAEAPDWKMKPQVSFANPDRIPENIQNECHLPQYQGEAVRAAAAKAGLMIDFDDTAEPASSPALLQLQISGAVSEGHAFLGHHKQLSVIGYIYINGEKRATFRKNRKSMGGFAGGFKSSCDVLERCADTLAEDFVSWVQQQQAQVATVATTTPTPPATAAAPSTSTPAASAN